MVFVQGRVHFRFSSRPVGDRHRPAVGGVLAQRVEQGDGPAEDQVGRRGDPPWQVARVGDPVAGIAADQERLEPRQDAVEVDRPDRQRDDARDEQPSGSGRPGRRTGSGPGRRGSPAACRSPGRGSSRWPGSGRRPPRRTPWPRSVSSRRLCPGEGQVDPDQLERGLAGDRGADDVEEQAGHRAEAAQQEPGGGVIGRVVARGPASPPAASSAVDLRLRAAGPRLAAARAPVAWSATSIGGSPLYVWVTASGTDRRRTTSVSWSPRRPCDRGLDGGRRGSRPAAA